MKYLFIIPYYILIVILSVEAECGVTSRPPQWSMVVDEHGHGTGWPLMSPAGIGLYVALAVVWLTDHI